MSSVMCVCVCVCVCVFKKEKEKEKYEHHQHYEKKVFNPTPLSGTPSYGGSSIEAVEVKTKMNRVDKKKSTSSHTS